jgi:hypothetical protein
MEDSIEAAFASNMQCNPIKTNSKPLLKPIVPPKRNSIKTPVKNKIDPLFMNIVSHADSLQVQEDLDEATV